MSGLGAIITIIIVVAWIVRGLSSVVGNQDQGEKRQGRSLEEWDEIQSQRRSQMTERQEALSEMRAESSAQDPAQMTMAQRIELARQRARQQAGLSGQDEAQAEALRRARQQAERQAQAQQQRANAEQLARRQRAERERAAQQQRVQAERVKQQRRRQAQEQAEQQAQRQRRSKQQRRSQPNPARAATGSKREGVVNKSLQRVHKDHGHNVPTVSRIANTATVTQTADALGALSRSDLRKAFIMKELLDKPVALRGPQEELYW
ncbi:MAG: hypothetical protein AB8C95_05845 [Phycisphaeraceae bacterium]